MPRPRRCALARGGRRGGRWRWGRGGVRRRARVVLCVRTGSGLRFLRRRRRCPLAVAAATAALASTTARTTAATAAAATPIGSHGGACGGERDPVARRRAPAGRRSAAARGGLGGGGAGVARPRRLRAAAGPAARPAAARAAATGSDRRHRAGRIDALRRRGRRAERVLDLLDERDGGRGSLVRAFASPRPKTASIGSGSSGAASVALSGWSSTCWRACAVTGPPAKGRWPVSSS